MSSSSALLASSSSYDDADDVAHHQHPTIASSSKVKKAAVPILPTAAKPARRRKRAAVAVDEEEEKEETGDVAVAAATKNEDGSKQKKAASKRTKKSDVITTAPATAATAAPTVVVLPSTPRIEGTRTLLYTLPPLFKAVIVNRPSKTIKSPYLADIRLEGGKEDEIFMCHNPALGCKGLLVPGKQILVSKSTSTTAKSTHVLHYCVETEADNTSHHIGTHPQAANHISSSLLLQGHVLDRPVKNLAKEVTLGNSRFDFVVTHDDGSTTVVETKNVPLADHCDGNKKERAKFMGESGVLDPYSKMALFPEGYRKKAADPVSPRALKHVQELQAIALEGKMKACLLFIIQRTDVSRLRITKTDPIYRDAVVEAKGKGVMMKAFSIRWEGSEAFLHRELDFDWEE